MIHEESLNGNQIPWFNNPDAPKYPGIDWSHPTPFIQKMIQRDLENGVDMKAKFEDGILQIYVPKTTVEALPKKNILAIE